MTRLTWAGTKHKQLCGHYYKAGDVMKHTDFASKYNKGVVCQFEPAEKNVALELFDSVIQNPGIFPLKQEIIRELIFFLVRLGSDRL